MTPEARREAYLDDVTYVTNSELGFDYLRDNLAGVSAGDRCWLTDAGRGEYWLQMLACFTVTGHHD